MKRTGWLRRRKALSKMSPKRKRESRIYTKLRKVFLEENPVCQFLGCRYASTDVHHAAKRGKNYLRVETWKAVCRGHHDWIEANKRLAEEMGLIVRDWRAA